MKINPYLFFKGNCEEAFKTYADVLGGKIEAMLPHKGSPAEAHTPKEWHDKIMHAALKIGDQLLMASDAPPGHQSTMSGFSVSIEVPTVADAERVFAGLSKGGTVGMPLQETFFAKSFGMLTDRFGTRWMINCAKPM
jgi:PhnB protein